jgi:hypothetical protein
MNQKSNTTILKSMLIVASLLTLTLNACAAKDTEVIVPTAQRIATLEPTVLPSPIPPPPSPVLESTDDRVVDAIAFLALATKPDVPPQTIDGVTVTIDQAYADESRVGVYYTISGLDWPDNVQMNPTLMASLSSTVIHDIGRGAGGWSTGIVKEGVLTGFIDQMLTAGAVDAAQSPIVDLQVDIPVDGTGAILVLPSSTGQIQQPTPMQLPRVGRFRFKFKIPISQGIKLMDINQTVEANGISITLKSLILNRSHVDALLCFDMPSEKDWSPELRFGIGSAPDQNTPQAFGSSLFRGDGKGFSLSDPERCVGMGTDASYEGGPTRVFLTIPKLKTSIPERIPDEMVQQANERLADRGIVFEVITQDHGNNFNILKRPDGMPDTELYPLIWDALGDWYEGPWEFTVEVKP